MRQLALAAVLVLASCCSTGRHAEAPAPAGHDSGHPHGHTHGHTHGEPHGAAHGGAAPTDDHRFEDAEKWAEVFEDPQRDQWQKPDEVISALSVPKGGKVADIGAATGYFPVRIARAHPDATVYGVDIEADMVRFLGERAKKEGLANVRAVLGAPEDPKLPEAVDRVLLVNTYHHIGDRPAYFQRLAASLRPGAKLVVVDYKLDAPRGPRHKMAPEQVTEELGQAGYRVVDRRDLPHQYLLVFERAQ